MRRFVQRLAVAILSFAVLVGAGCSGNSTTVTGKVTYKEKTVVWGTVQLIDSTGLTYTGDIDLQGNYKVEGVKPGPVQIGVSSPDPTPRSGAKGGKGATGGGGAAAGAGLKGPPENEDPREKFLREQGLKQAKDERPLPPTGAWFPIPRELADPINSGLTGTVEAGKPLDINIKK
jgi:hypothetical protein